MAARRPLVSISGVLNELPVGDTLLGGSAPEGGTEPIKCQFSGVVTASDTEDLTVYLVR